MKLRVTLIKKIPLTIDNSNGSVMIIVIDKVGRLVVPKKLETSFE
jgi:hypothetical protein